MAHRSEVLATFLYAVMVSAVGHAAPRALTIDDAVALALLQAQSELRQARLNLTRAQYGLVLSDVAITRASGG